MPVPVRCRECGGAFEPGFILDLAHGGLARSSWARGEAQPSFWTHVKRPGPDQLYPLKALRCSGCSRVELYAPQPGQP